MIFYYCHWRRLLLTPAADATSQDLLAMLTSSMGTTDRLDISLITQLPLEFEGAGGRDGGAVLVLVGVRGLVIDKAYPAKSLPGIWR